jgi:UPF0288 family protein (methanogenesis marker protein 3)
MVGESRMLKRARDQRPSVLGHNAVGHVAERLEDIGDPVEQIDGGVVTILIRRPELADAIGLFFGEAELEGV